MTRDYTQHPFGDGDFADISIISTPASVFVCLVDEDGRLVGGFGMDTARAQQLAGLILEASFQVEAHTASHPDEGPQ